MSKIKVLSPFVANLIAAGEVVERPGSVVKELLENAVDAGARAVTVEIKNGGMSFIRVTDNGCGMLPDDAETAFLRHATSKISDEADLEAISSLGFRGEALAAIASVSRIDLLTKPASEQAGSSLSLEAGTLTDSAPAGCPDGTTIIVRDLFYNTPARMKFMKRDSAEAANVHTVVSRIALSHPEISFKYIKDGREDLHTPGDGILSSCVYSVLGRDFALGTAEAEGRGADIAVSGYVTRPDSTHGNRGNQYFFVNGRYVKSPLLTAALEEAYKNRIMTARFPGCVIHIEVDPRILDVNVHPTKIEVKFLRDREVFDVLYHAVLSALDADRGVPELVYRPASGAGSDSGQPASTSPGSYPSRSPSSFGRMTEGCGRHASTGSITRSIMPPLEEERPSQLYSKAQTAYSAGNATTEAPTAPPEPLSAIGERGWRIIGEALATYIIVEQADGILLIDKHAAHERLIFDRLSAGDAEIMPQLLLAPAVVSPGAEEVDLILENLSLLSSLGFEIDDFGGGALAVRQIPSDVGLDQIDALICELARILSTGRSTGPELLRVGLLESIACKAAIKAGRGSEPEELRVLVEAVVSGRVKHCPHGRPVSVFMSKRALDKGFNRE